MKQHWAGSDQSVGIASVNLSHSQVIYANHQPQLSERESCSDCQVHQIFYMRRPNTAPHFRQGEISRKQLAIHSPSPPHIHTHKTEMSRQVSLPASANDSCCAPILQTPLSIMLTDSGREMERGRKQEQGDGRGKERNCETA